MYAAMNTGPKLGLGTVQFGVDYGVTNDKGRVPLDEARHILAAARRHGIDLLDTAAAYGDSETVLGRLLPSGRDFDIVTKTVPLRRTTVDAAALTLVSEGFRSSLTRLQCGQVNAVLVHHANDLLCPGGDGLYDLLCEWRSDGFARRIGVSVYDQAEIEQLHARYRFDIVQLPANVFDQRLAKSGVLQWLADQGVAIHVRSAFLQGALIASLDRLPNALLPLAPHLERYHARLRECEVSPMAAALAYVQSLPGVECVLIGVQSVRELEECCRAFSERVIFDFSEFSCVAPDLIDPRRWIQ